MSRSKWKGPYISFQFLNNFKFISKNRKFTILRNFEIIPLLVGTNAQVYNGERMSNIRITEDMIGHKLGEFSFTRKRFTFKKKRIKQK